MAKRRKRWGRLLKIVLRAIPDDLEKKAIDAALDVIENAVADSKNKIDDMVVLPLCKILRRTFDVPDDD